jgi:hypothetical protein
VNTRRILSVLGICAVVAAISFFIYSVSRGSSDLKVGRITADAPNYPEGAIPYTLPQKSLVIATTTKIVGCRDTSSGEEIRGTTNLSINDLIEIDPEQRYYIYFQSSSRGKGLDYQVNTYENGTLKSVTTSIRDQVAPITASIIGALVKFVPLPPPAPPPPAPVPLQSNCRDLNAAIVHNKDDIRFTIRQENIWTPYSQEYGSRYTVWVDFSDALRREFSLRAPHWRWPNAELRLQFSNVSGSSQVDYYAGDSGNTKCQGNTPSQPPDADAKPCLAKGLILRNPALTTLRYWVCDATCDAWTKIAATSRVPPTYEGDISALTPFPSVAKTIPQFGKLLVFPVHSGYAENAELVAGLSADGLITALQLKTDSALASNISSLSESAKSSLSALTPVSVSVTQANKNLADCLGAQKTVIEHGGTPIGACH